MDDAIQEAKWNNKQRLNYLLSDKKYKHRLKDIATGTSGSMKNISKTALLEVVIPFPPPIEQQAIALVLSDMDVEIATLEDEREKIVALKQGMMQELLTGQTRLV